MASKVHHITHSEVPAVQAKLKELGYNASKQACFDYIINLANRLEPMDRAARFMLINAIEDAVDSVISERG